MRVKPTIILIGLVFILSGFVTSDTDIYYRINRSIELLGRVYREAAINYVDDINPEELMEEGINGMLSALDPYTVYLDESHKNDIDLITKGKYGGIGATVGVRNDHVTIVDLIEGYSAQRQGIMIGDIIIEIDGVEVNQSNYAELGTLMKGEPGTSLTMVIKREGTKNNLVFSLVREEIEIKNVTFYGFVPEESNNVYIKLSGFSRAAGEEIKDAIIELRKEKEIESIVLDLRGNPGGLLDAAIDVSEKFLTRDKLVVSVVGRDTSNIRNYYAKEEPIAQDSKLAVLIDGYSASAAEIVTGAIQDHDRGIIVGNKSFGKGLVQTIIPMPHNSSLKITTAKYYTPSGRCIQEIDYSDNNEVFEGKQISEDYEYQTDNNRVVFARGGIVPDSTVNEASESGLVNQLLAYGMFFKYANRLFSETNTLDKSKISDETLFAGFKKYIGEEDFEFNFEIDLELQRLKKILKNRKDNAEMLDLTDKLIMAYDKHRDSELDLYKNEIVKALRLEIISRLEGRQGRIRASLIEDKQFEACLSLMNNEDEYNKLLNNID